MNQNATKVNNTSNVSNAQAGPEAANAARPEEVIKLRDRADIQSYLAIFRTRRYKISWRTLPADPTTEMLVVEPPCFVGDLTPIAEETCFSDSPKVLSEMANFFANTEVLIHQRLEAMRVRNLMEILSDRLLSSITTVIHYQQPSRGIDQLKVVFSKDGEEHWYDYNQPELMRFVRDLLKLGKTQDGSPFEFVDLYEALAEDIVDHRLQWIALSCPDGWPDDQFINESPHELVIQPRPFDNPDWELHFTDDLEGALAFMVWLCDEYLSGPVLEYLVKPDPSLSL